MVAFVLFDLNQLIIQVFIFFFSLYHATGKDAFTDSAEILNQTKRLAKIQAVALEVNVA